MQLRWPYHKIHAEIVEQGEREVLPDDGYHILQVRHHAGIAARDHDASYRHGYGVEPATRVRRIDRNALAGKRGVGDAGIIRVDQRHAELVSQEDIGRDGADVEAADIILAAGVETLGRVGGQSTVSGDE